MIDLRLKVDPLPIDTPLVVRLREELCEDRGPHDAVLLDVAGDRREYDFNGFSWVSMHEPVRLWTVTCCYSCRGKSAPIA